MDEEGKIPTMMRLRYGENAWRIQLVATERLRRWCEAFDKWLDERRTNFKPSTHKQSLLTWKRLLRQQNKLPWELQKEDIERHARWMRAEGHATSTITNSIGLIGNFYQWCSDKRVDPECEPGFNPAAAVERPRIQRYETATMLSRSEVGELLRALRADASPLGKRDYALILARLRLGIPQSNLQRLKWGQIELEEGKAWVRWRRVTERALLPDEVWEAIEAYLAASGRLAIMTAEKFVFAPLADPLREERRDRAEAWEESKCLSSDQARANLKIYGRLAAIPEEKLTFRALLRTAVRLKLDEGSGTKEMRSFLDSLEGAKFTRYRLTKLPELPAETQNQYGENADKAIIVPVRSGKPFKPWEGMTHGFYALSQPPQEMVEILAEGLVGIELEIAGLRILARGLLNRDPQSITRGELASLMEAYTRAAYWLGKLIEIDRELERKREERRNFMRIQRIMSNLEYGTAGEAQAEETQEGMQNKAGDLHLATRQLTEEIASMRLVVRRTFYLAGEAQDIKEQVRLTDLYNRGCMRLAKLIVVQDKAEEQQRSNERWKAFRIKEILRGRDLGV